MLRIRVLYGPKPEIVSMILQRSVASESIMKELAARQWGAVAIIQTPIYELYYFADLAVKAGSVTAVEILGNCVHQIGAVALFGDVSSVEAAVNTLRQNESERA